jgi:hypothetical protein
MKLWKTARRRIRAVFRISPVDNLLCESKSAQKAMIRMGFHGIGVKIRPKTTKQWEIMGKTSLIFRHYI